MAHLTREKLAAAVQQKACAQRKLCLNVMVAQKLHLTVHAAPEVFGKVRKPELRCRGFRALGGPCRAAVEGMNGSVC